MGFKVGMLNEALIRKEYVFDQSRGLLAQVFFDSEEARYFLRYLDGSIAMLVRDTFNQMEPIQLHLAPTLEQLQAMQAWENSSKIIPANKCIFEGELVPTEFRKEDKDTGLKYINLAAV
jgi:hypothetical protein